MSITGDRLRELRKTKRKTLRDVWIDTGTSWSGLAEIERGERNCNSTTLKILANYYQVSTDYLMGTTDDMSPTNDIDVAFYNQHGIITEEQRKEIENFIAFIKSRDNKK